MLTPINEMSDDAAIAAAMLLGARLVLAMDKHQSPSGNELWCCIGMPMACYTKAEMARAYLYKKELENHS